MEEMFEQSVNNVEVAEPQLDEVQDTSVNNSEVADSKPVQDAETNARFAEMRRNQELNDVRTKASEYEQHLNRVAQLSGHQSHEDFIRALDTAEQNYKREQEEQMYREAGIDPETFNSLLSNHPDVQYARQLRAQQEQEAQERQEAFEFFNEFPDVKPEDIPKEVFILQKEKGLSLIDAYLRTSYKSLSQKKEQEAIQKLTQNALSTPGSLGAGTEHKTGYSSLTDSDKKALRDRVLRGENVQL
jgi:hypothetical protein